MCLGAHWVARANHGRVACATRSGQLRFSKCFGLPDSRGVALSDGMSTLTLAIKKPARPFPFARQAKRQRKPQKYVFGLGLRNITPVHTGIKDLSTREGLDA